MTVAASDIDFIRGLVLKRAAIVLEASKQYLIESRLDPLLRRENVPSMAALVERLRRHPADGLADRVVEAMTTNETSFFRDVHPFEALRGRIIPELIAKRKSERQLNIWCAAASSGQEPYSLALLLREHFSQALTGWRVRILATDLSAEVLDRARHGRFSQLEVNRGLPAALLMKYFDKESGMCWRIKEDIREMIEFRKLNLIEPWSLLGNMDLVLIRNVLIYFDVPTKREILRRIRQSLRSDGYLMLGGAETLVNLELDKAYARVAEGKTVFYRVLP